MNILAAASRTTRNSGSRISSVPRNLLGWAPTIPLGRRIEQNRRIFQDGRSVQTKSSHNLIGILNIIKLMKILITGGAGFVGSHLADKLIGRATKSRSLTTFRPAAIQISLISKTATNFRLIIDTVLNEKLMEELVRETDRVLSHGQRRRRKADYGTAGSSTIETIFRGTDVVLGFCSRYRKRVLIPSTSEVYGKGATVPFKEDDDLLTGATDKHRWAYACAKTLDEFLALAHWKETRLPVVVVRLFNTVGPRQTGPIRNGRAEICPGRVEERTDRGSRRRYAVSMFRARPGCRRRTVKTSRYPDMLRPGHQSRQRRGSFDQGSLPTRRSH